jgi:hypothetical protein
MKNIFIDLVFHLKNYVSYKTRDTAVGEFMRTHLKKVELNASALL